MRDLVFDAKAFDDLAWWIEHDRKKAMQLIKLIKAIQRDPQSGLGQPEPLRHQFSGCWSRRIDQEHRLIYEVFEDRIVILACRYPLTGYGNPFIISLCKSLKPR